MERHFDREESDLKDTLLEMGFLTQSAIIEAMDSLKSLDSKKAYTVIGNDKAIDDFENTITEKCLDLLALQQPLASDLRFITMTMKITTDLERIADLAVDIAQRVLILADKPPLLTPFVDIPELAVLAQQMVKDALDSFINKNVILANKVIFTDSEADRLRDAIQNKLIEDFMSKKPSTTSRALPMLLIARHLERICDHATNIAEDVIFMVNAEIVKHHHPVNVDRTIKTASQNGIKTRVLFVCVNNSARSQMAEAYLNKLAGNRFVAESAGMDPGTLNPLVVESMKQDGIDISGNKTKSVFDFYKQGAVFDYVITVCDKDTAERCPIFPGTTQRLYWSFHDPAKLEGSDEDKLIKIAEIRDSIKEHVLDLINVIE